ncbi:8257_t:CDS:1, partial [Racocetra fulgida]
LKYPVSQAQNSQVTPDHERSEDQPELMSSPPKKKRKTLPFARLLTEEESWHQLNELNEEAERKAEEIKRKKEAAAQKKEAAAQRKEAAAKKKEVAAKKKEALAKKKEAAAQKKGGATTNSNTKRKSG